MILSNVLVKSYKTPGAYKRSIRKYRTTVQDHLIDLQQCQKKGWNIYLGDPIYPQIRDYKTELVRISNELKSLKITL